VEIMAGANAGDTVRVHYTGRLEDGTVFDSSEGRSPLEFTLGEGRVISGFDDAVEGMNPGDQQTVTIPSGRAYGPRREELVLEVDRSNFPDDLDPEVGQPLQVDQQGQMFVVTVRDVSPSSITLDANHPLAGRDLTFDLQLVEIV
jgi:peptidylprolyl isomerase